MILLCHLSDTWQKSPETRKEWLLLRGVRRIRSVRRVRHRSVRDCKGLAALLLDFEIQCLRPFLQPLHEPRPKMHSEDRLMALDVSRGFQIPVKTSHGAQLHQHCLQKKRYISNFRSLHPQEFTKQHVSGLWPIRCRLVQFNLHAVTSVSRRRAIGSQQPSDVKQMLHDDGWIVCNELQWCIYNILMVTMLLCSPAPGNISKLISEWMCAIRLGGASSSSGSPVKYLSEHKANWDILRHKLARPDKAWQDD